MDTKILFEKKGTVGYLSLVTEKKYPILHSKVIRELAELGKKIDKDKQLKSIIIYSTNDGFCTGFDVNDFLNLSEPELRKTTKIGMKLLDKVEASEKIFIAAVNGYCIGGGFESVMAYDYVIASPDAKFGLPEVKLGIIPGVNGIKRLVKSIGKKQAFDMLITGKFIDAKKAKRLGLIQEIVPKRKLLKRAEEIAQDIDQKNHMAVKMIKHLANEGTKRDISNDEAESFLKCRKSEFARQTIKGFLNKNKK